MDEVLGGSAPPAFNVDLLGANSPEAQQPAVAGHSNAAENEVPIATKHLAKRTAGAAAVSQCARRRLKKKMEHNAFRQIQLGRMLKHISGECSTATSAEKLRPGSRCQPCFSFGLLSH